jgi:hypothetical protein
VPVLIVKPIKFISELPFAKLSIDIYANRITAIVMIKVIQRISPPLLFVILLIFCCWGSFRIGIIIVGHFYLYRYLYTKYYIRLKIAKINLFKKWNLPRLHDHQI